MRSRTRGRLAAGLDRVHLLLPLPAVELLWFALPFSTMGTATWLFLLVAGCRLRSRWLIGWAAWYLVLVAVFFVAGGGSRAAVVGLTLPCFLVTWLVGGFHSASAGRRVWHAARADLVARRGYVSVPAAAPVTAAERCTPPPAPAGRRRAAA